MDPATALAEAIEEALPGWVQRCVRQRLPQASAEVLAAAGHAGQRARVEVGAEVRSLLALDVEEQRTNPLSVLRSAVRYPTAVLQAAGVAPVDRDEFSRQRFPEDAYDLTPATWSDVDPALVDPGITWGAAKAFIFKSRHPQ